MYPLTNGVCNVIGLPAQKEMLPVITGIGNVLIVTNGERSEQPLGSVI